MAIICTYSCRRIEQHGDWQTLVRRKKHFAEEVKGRIWIRGRSRVRGRCRDGVVLLRSVLVLVCDLLVTVTIVTMTVITFIRTLSLIVGATKRSR